MENDNGHPDALRGLVVAEIAASLAESQQQDFTQAQRIEKLLADVNSIMAMPTGFPNIDDQIGALRQLTLPPLLLARTHLGPRSMTLDFKGSDARYGVTVTISAG